jgi:hypothetical protein
VRDCRCVAEQEKRPWAQAIDAQLLPMTAPADAFHKHEATALPMPEREAVMLSRDSLHRSGKRSG